MRKINPIILIILCITAWSKYGSTISTDDKALEYSAQTKNISKIACYDNASFQNKINDLVQRDYGNALDLNKGSVCYLDKSSFNHKPDNISYIVITNFLTGEKEIISNFKLQECFQYTVPEDGVFGIFLVSKNTIYDVTKQATVTYACMNESDSMINCYSP